MKKFFKLTLICAVIFPCAMALGEDIPAPPSIYHIEPWTDGILIGSTTLLTASAITFQYQLIDRRCPCDPNEVNSFDRPAIYNQSSLARSVAGFTVLTALVAPIAVDYLDIGFSKAFAEDMIVYAETMTVTWFLVTASKFSTQRPLPRLYAAQDQGNPSDYLSFYSGHTATTVAALSALSMTYTARHGWSLWPWLTTGLVGTSIAYEMVDSAGHFPSDVIVGFLMGGLVGWAVPHFHSKAASISLAPVESGAMALWTRNF
jgi:membrane-associated phospholipid phosphatase